MQSLLLIISSENGTEEDPTKAFNKFNMNVKTADLVKSPVFTDYVEILHKTDTIQKKVKEKNEHDTCSGSAKHDNDFGKEPKDELNRIRVHRIDTKQNHRITLISIFR